MEVTKLEVVKVVAAILGGIVGIWVTIPALVQVLLIFVLLDVVTGFFAAIVAHEVASKPIWIGGVRKFILLLVVYAAWLLDPHAEELFNVNLPIGQAVTIYYLAHEMISITENAKKADIPVPPFIIRLVSVLKGQAAQGDK